MGTPIASDQAWRTFSDWESTGREIGLIFFATSGTTIYTMGFVQSAGNGGLQSRSESVNVSFNLRGANFSYGPIQTWPRWPVPPIVEMMAIQAQLENGDWLVLAEGLRPESLPPRALPT